MKNSLLLKNRGSWFIVFSCHKTHKREEEMAKKSYQEVVRGIRSSKDPTMYISEVLTEIRQEIKGTDRNDKVISLQKLLYLNLLGYTFDWAVSNYCIMRSYRRSFTCLGCVLTCSYLAATVLIRPDSELFILCANTLKKAFLSKNKVGCSN